MSLRFRRSIKLAPGIKMNLSGSGVSWTLGPRGASIGIGRRGTFLNTGIPGTGLYSRSKLSGASSSSRGYKLKTITTKVSVNDEGIVCFLDDSGNPLSEQLVRVAKKQQGDVIRDMIQKKCDEINEQIEALGEMHIHTPSPTSKPVYLQKRYDVYPPKKPIEKRIGLLAKIFSKLREKTEVANLEALHKYERALEEWNNNKKQFEAVDAQRKAFIEIDIYEKASAMEAFLEENLQEIIWPRETLVTAEIKDDGESVFVDVDLPEIEDMPTKTATVPQRGLKLSVKEMTVTNIQRLYMQHVHGIGFRIIGEAFAALPKAKEVVLSGYSQRTDSARGSVTDQYLYSVRVDRNLWERINFSGLDKIDVVEALAQFELRRKMTKTGKFTSIEPFDNN